MVRLMPAVGAILLLCASAAGAAELAPDAVLVPEEPPQVPVFSWTGRYAGVHVGYDLGRDRVATHSRGGIGLSGGSPNGGVGGFHAGYNRALPSRGPQALVVGVEGDIDGADYRRTVWLPGGSTTVRSDIKGSLRARAAVAGGRMLYYATGGAAFATFDTRSSGAMLGPGAAEAFQRVQTGFTLGGGVEYAVLNYVSLRAEYRHTDYGSFTDQSGAAAPGQGASATHRDSDNRLQAGVSYKFD